MGDRTRKARRFSVEPLEPRLLLSADWAGVLAPPWSDDAGQLPSVADDLWLPPMAQGNGSDVTAPEPLDLSALGELHSHESADSRLEVVVVDAGVDGFEELVADITGRDSDSQYLVHVIEADVDGIASLSALLAGLDSVDAVHIVSHGDDGGFQLGNTWLDSASVGAHADALGGWSESLAEDADLLVYGCNLAATEDGLQLVDSLATFTGADVAASDDLTGSASLGGNWNFEHQVGSVQTTVAFSTTLQSQWNGVLAAFIVDSFADTVDINPGDGVAEDASGNTSLRAAIMEANALAGADFILLPSGHYDITIPFGAGPADSHGDLDINDDLTLVGAGADSTTIDGNNLHRVLDIDNGVTATVSGVTIERGGNISVGGGINVQNNATLTLLEAVVRDNDQDIDYGAGIFNNGTLFLVDVTVHGNAAEDDGGGLYNEGTATLNRVTFYDNTAATGGGVFHASDATGTLSVYNSTVSSNGAITGGGIYVQQETLIVSSTITNNGANFGGGVVKESGSYSLRLSSSIIAGNSAFTSNDVIGNFTSLGFNLIGDDTGSNNLIDGVSNDQVGSFFSPIDPLLGGLADNGGYVLTHELLPGSPAINAGNPVTPFVFDARVATRDAFPDIGAFELGGTINFTPTATNLNQSLSYLEDGSNVALAPIVVTETDAGHTLTVILTLADPNAGALTASSGNGESYTAGTGVWTVSGDVADVNAALAAVSFAPAGDYAQATYVTASVRDASDHGPPIGLILLNPTPVNDAPDFVILGDQWVVEGTAQVVAGFAVASPGGGADEASQTFTYTVNTTNAALFAVAPAIDASGTLTYTLAPGVTGVATVTVSVRDSGGTANGGVDSSGDQTFDIIVLDDAVGPMLLFSTVDDVTTIGSPGIDTWYDETVIGFGGPGLSFGANAATSGMFSLQFELGAFGSDVDVNGMHFVNSTVTVGSGAGEFTLLAGDLLLTFNGGGDATFNGMTTAITVQESDIFVFRPKATGDYTDGEFYYLLDNPLNDNVRGLALVESASVTVGDGPALLQGTFLLSERSPGEHDNIYTYVPLTVGDGNTTSTLGRQLLVNAEGAGNLNFSDQIQGIHLIEQASVIGGITFLPGDLLLTLNQDQIGGGEGVGTNRLEVAQNDVFRLRLSETHQGPNGRSIGVAAMVFDGSAVSLSGDSTDLDALTLIPGAANVAPDATNLDQVVNYTEDDLLVDLADIVVSDANAGDTITVVLTLADTSTGTLTAGSGNGETYDPGTGIWTVTGTVAEVNAALAAVAFVPASNNAVSTTISTHVEDLGGLGPLDGVISLNVTPVNDAPSLTLGPNQNVLEDSGPHTVVGFAVALPGGGADEAGQTFFYTVMTDNPGLFLVAPTIDASGTLTYTLNPNANGSARVTVTVTDSGGTANGGVNTSPAQFFDIVVTPVNDAPTFTLQGDLSLVATTTPQTVTGFATAMPGGGADELGQNLSFIVNTDNPGLFAVGPAIDAAGNLTYTLRANATGTVTVTVTVVDSGGTANGGVDTAPDQTFDITVLVDADGPSLLLSTSADVTVFGPPGVDSWFNNHVIAFGDPGLSFGADAATAGQFDLQFVLSDFGDDQDINGMHFVNRTVTVGSGAGQFTLLAGDLLLTVNGAGDFTYVGSSTSITVQRSDVFVFRPGASGDYSDGEFYLLLDDPIGDNIRGLALVESASVTIGDGPALVQGTFLFSEINAGVHDNIYTYVPLTVGEGATTSTLGAQLLIDGEDAGNLNYSDWVHGIHLIEADTVIGGISFLAGDLLLTLNSDQTSGGEGVGGTTLQVTKGDVFRLRLTETQQGANGRSVGIAEMVFDGSAVGLDVSDGNVDALTLVYGNTNFAPSATNLSQVVDYTEDAPLVALGNIVVSDANAGDVITVVLTLADVNAGSLTTGSGNGEFYDALTGKWAVTGTVAQVNAALAAVAFVPTADYAANTSIATHVEDAAGAGPADGLILLNVTAVNDAPILTLGGNQFVNEDSGPQTVVGFAAALAGGGTDELGQTFSYLVVSDNPGLFAVGPMIDASGTLTYTLNPNANGTARITVTLTDSGGTANGGIDSALPQTFDIVVAPVNDAPTLVIGGNQVVDEGSGVHIVTGFASALPGGGTDEAGQNLVYMVVADNAALFAVGPAIDASGTLTYTLNSNVSGSARITVTVTDSGGTANGGVDTSPAQFFDIVVNALPGTATAVNLDQLVLYLEDAGRVELDDIAVSGIANGALVTATLTLSDTGTGSLSADSGNGETYDAATGVWQVTGTAAQVNAALANVGFLTAADNARNTTIAVTLAYPNGNAPGTGIIRLDVTAVNDAPTFVLLGDQVVLEDAGSQQLAGFAAALSGGGLDEAGQTFTYTVTADNPDLFTIAPYIDADGTLNYTLADNAFGSAMLSITLTDSGDLANGGQNAAAGQAVMLRVLPVNDAPSGQDGNVTTLTNSPYIFGLDDFGFSDVTDGDAFAAIQITSVPEGAGALLNNGRVVLPGDVIDVATIEAGGLVFLPQNTIVGTTDGVSLAFTSLGFRVQDSGGTAFGGLDTDSQARRVTIGMVGGGGDGSAELPVPSVEAPVAEEPVQEAPAREPEPEVAVIDAVTVPEQETLTVDVPLPGTPVVDIQPVEVFTEDVVPLVPEDESGAVILPTTATDPGAPERVFVAVPEVVEWRAELNLETEEDGRQLYYLADADTTLSLDTVRDAIDEDLALMSFEVGQTAGAVVGLSVGYVSWLLRERCRG
ncbi:MAG: DUF4347 domain-containing protein [Pseudomonadota bacterium]